MRPAQATPLRTGYDAPGVLIAPLLAGIAGYVDAIAYLTLHAFVANMTGTIVLLGIAFSEGDLRAAMHGGLAVGSFLFGVVASRSLRDLSHGVGLSLLATAAVLGAATVGTVSGVAAVALLAFAMGLQNAAATQFAGVGLNTAFLTGNLEHLGEALAEPAPPQAKVTRPTRILLIGLVLTTYAVGAACGAAAIRWFGKPLFVPASLLLIAAALARRGTGARSPA